MVHTRHSYSQDIEKVVDGEGNIDDDDESSESADAGDDKVKDIKVNGDESLSTQPCEVQVDDANPKPKKRRKTLVGMYEKFDFHDTTHRRSLRNLDRRGSYLDRQPSKKRTRSNSTSIRFQDYGTLLIRRSDRQPKKVFESFNEAEIQKCIERKHQEILELREASMYDSIKQRRGEASDTHEDEEESGEEEEGSEEEVEESEGEEEEPKSYSLRERKEKPKAKVYKAAARHTARHYADLRSPLHKSSRIRRVPQHASSPHHRGYKRLHRSSSTSSSDDEAGFERRKSKSMASARSRCLPMNFRPDDITGALKNRERAKDGLIGSSLADVHPMTIDSKTSFSDVGGLNHHIRSLKEMVVFPLLYPEVFQKFSISPPRGVLFYGPPGTGKTLVARALANECSSEGKKVAFFMRKGADCLSKWVGESERQLRLLFDQAYCMRPSIIFFDEIDGIAPVRSTRQDQIHSSIVSTLLALMDGLDSRGEIVIIGATNRLDSIDPALRRPGRFDREFLFKLPNKPAREKILSIHTSSWKPKLSKEFISEVSEKCVGYCGADIKALCTEAALFALRRRYPQIYDTNKKLVLDTNQIKICVIDFKNALRSVTPASHRSKTSPSKCLPEEIKPLLQSYVEKGVDYLYKVFPQAKVASEESSKAPIASSAEENIYMFEKAKPKNQNNTSSTSFFHSTENKIDGNISHRPRLLIHGVSGNGQISYVAPALLFVMEHLTTHVLDLPALYDNSSRSPEEAVSLIFREAKRTPPCILYMPHIDVWWDNVSDVTKATFRTQLQDLPVTASVLLLASTNSPWNELSEGLKKMFSIINQELLEIKHPTPSDRYEYFKDIFLHHAIKVTSLDDNITHEIEREVLLEAPPEKPRELSKEESKRLVESEETTLRELRLFLRSITWKLLHERKFKEFSKPVDLEEVDDYLAVVTEPMDLSTMMTRINAHHYNSCAHYLTDVDLIVNNCLEYNPDKDQFDKLLRNRACEMRDTAHALVYNDLDPEFEKLCLEIQDSREKRNYNDKSNAPSFIKVMPRFPNAANSNIENELCKSPAKIPDPTGTRFSRRVRGLSDPTEFSSETLDIDEGRRRSKNPLEMNAVSADEEGDEMNAMEVTTVVETVDTTDLPCADNQHETNEDENAEVDNVKRSLEFDKGSEDVNLEEEAETLLSKLVEQTAIFKVEDLECIYTRICRLIGQHRDENNRSLVLEYIKEFIGEMS